MTMYLVLSALTVIPISLVAATKASAFSFRVCNNSNNNNVNNVYNWGKSDSCRIQS